MALPIYLQTVVGWSHTEVGAYIALWIIGYGIIQASTPKIMRSKKGSNPTSSTAMKLAIALAGIPFAMAWQLEVNPELIIVIGLALFGVMFALNSAVHSYLIVSAATHDGTSKDVGFYYMANAGGRLLGTVLSGYVYQVAGMEACLMIAGFFILISAALVLKVPKTVLN